MRPEVRVFGEWPVHWAKSVLGTTLPRQDENNKTSRLFVVLCSSKKKKSKLEP